MGYEVGPRLRESRLLDPSGRWGASSCNLGPTLLPSPVQNLFHNLTPQTVLSWNLSAAHTRNTDCTRHIRRQVSEWVTA